MGIDNMRRWPIYIILAVCILLAIQLFNSWGVENELRYQIGGLSEQVKDCAKRHAICVGDSLVIQGQKDDYATKLENIKRHNVKLEEELKGNKDKTSKAETQVNRTLVDVELCKAELQSLKNLQLSKSATLETLRLEKDTLTSQLVERKQKIEELEKEIENLKKALTAKTAQGAIPSKSTLATQVKQNQINLDNPINEPVIENNAQEDIEDNAKEDVNINDVNDVDPQLN